MYLLEHIPLIFEILGAFGLLLIAFYWFSRPVEKDRLMYGNKPFMLIVFMSVFIICFHYCPRNSFNISKSNKLIVTHQN